MRVDQSLQRALATWRTLRAGPFFGTSPPPQAALDRLPPEYVAVAGELGGCEGFLGDTFLRLYRLDELEAANVAYQVERYTPGLLVFGTNGCGEAFAFALPGFRVVQVPLIPLDPAQADEVAPDFGRFIIGLAATGQSAASNPQTLGLEVHHVHPICLGGDPVSPKNTAYVPPAKHAELAAYWNEVYARLRRGG